MTLVRVAAVDYGRRRIGLAIADALGITVRGLPTIERGADLAEGARRAAEALRAAGAGRVVVGLPLHADGRESEMSAEVRSFAALLGEASGLPVELFDEGLTSWEAEETIKSRAKPLRDARRRGEIDREAALAILRSWLRERESRPPPSA